MAHLDPGYARRARSLVIVTPVLAFLWARGAKFFANADERKDFTMSWKSYVEASKRGLLPTPGQFGKCALRWFKRDYHPSQDYSTGKAVAYLATSPAARAAAH
jgi:predicted metal-dependent hydrolase